MFAAAEKETSASGGGNSTMLGKIVDKIIPDAFLGKLEKALPEPDPKAAPDPEFEAKATTAVNNLEVPAETKSGLMQVVGAAVKNPQAQAMVLSLVGGVLGGLMSKAGPLIATFFPGGGTAAVAITGAIVAGGVAIAAAKLQGKPWKEAFKGAIKPALAGAAGAVIGQFAAGIAGAAVDKVAGAMSSNKPAGAAPESDYVKDMKAQGKDPNDPDGTIRLGMKGNSGDVDSTVSRSSINVADEPVIPGKPLSQTQMAVVDMSKKMGNTPSPEVQAAYDLAKSANSGVPAGATATDNAGSYYQNKTNPDGSSSQTVRQNADPADPRVMANIQAKQDYYKNDPQGQAQYKRIMAPSRFDSYIPTGKKLSEGQVYLVFNKIVTRNNYLIIEGRLVEGPMDWLKNKAKNLTTKVTADKLNSAWQKAGSPTDSEQLKKFLTDQGVAKEVVDKVYTDMKLPATSAPAAAAGADPAAAGAAGTQQSQDAAALDPKKAETLYAKVKKDILTLDKKSQKQITAYLQKQLGTA
jgi:ribosomal protein L12E/L44/L45/RPP1/RPP2